MKKLLIVEDDETLAAGLVRTFSRRGYSCFLAASCRDALDLVVAQSPSHVLLDLNLGNETTQEVIAEIRSSLPKAVIIVLTGYGTIPSTVRAIKDGADQYLCKPATPEAIEKAFEETLDKKSVEPAALWDLENNHILKVLNDCGGNISQAAKSLGLHRRTLQRKLKKLDPVT